MSEKNIIKGIFDGKEFNIDLPVNALNVSFDMNGVIKVTLQEPVSQPNNTASVNELNLDNVGYKRLGVDRETDLLIKGISAVMNIPLRKMVNVIVDSYNGSVTNIVNADKLVGDTVEIFAKSYFVKLAPLTTHDIKVRDVIKHAVLQFLNGMDNNVQEEIRNNVNPLINNVSKMNGKYAYTTHVLIPYAHTMKLDAMSKVLQITKRETVDSAMRMISAEDVVTYIGEEFKNYRGIATSKDQLANIKESSKEKITAKDIVSSAIDNFEKLLEGETKEKYLLQLEKEKRKPK